MDLVGQCCAHSNSVKVYKVLFQEEFVYFKKEVFQGVVIDLLISFIIRVFKHRKGLYIFSFKYFIIYNDVILYILVTEISPI